MTDTQEDAYSRIFLQEINIPTAWRHICEDFLLTLLIAGNVSTLEIPVKLMKSMKSGHIFLALTAGLLIGIGTGCKSIGLIGKPDNKIREEAVLPQDREKIVQPVASVYFPEELARGIVKGDWAIDSVYGKEAVGETSPYLKFDPDHKKVYGNNGCNVINADYRYNPADSTLVFSGLISTMMACSHTGITDSEISNALNSSRFYTWSLRDDDYYLYLYDETWQKLMVLMHQNFQFLNGTWRVSRIGDENVDIPDMKLVIDVDERKLHGDTGCNIINGTLETDMDAANSISIQEITAGHHECKEPKFEMQLIVALEEASRARAMTAGKVAFLNSQGKTVLILERTSDK